MEGFIVRDKKRTWPEDCVWPEPLETGEGDDTDWEDIEGEALLLRLDLAGIAASSGSACTSGSLDPSHVLLAIGLPHEVAHGSLRLSLTDTTTEEEVDEVLRVLPKIVETLRSMSPMFDDFINGKK